MAANVDTYTVLDAMILCGIDNNTLFNGNTQATRITTEVFSDDFYTCMDKSFTDIDEDFKSYGALTAVQGQIRVNPGIKRNVKAFIQWTRDQICTSEDPSAIPFPIDQVSKLLIRYNSHQSFCKKAKTISTVAKPEQFTENTKWEDWNPVFLNFLRSIPGRYGVPLKYVCRQHEIPIEGKVYPNFFDEYVEKAPLAGEAFLSDALEVHTFLISFIAGNATAEAKILPHETKHNGRIDYLALKEHYEGVGIHAIDVLQADNTISTLFYSGEKKPHMWWGEFEKRMTLAFTAYERHEQREVHSNQMKLQILCSKINADFLQHTKASINMELTKEPITMTYEQALASFRNEVNRKFPPEVNEANRRTRRVNEAMSNHRGRGRGRGFQRNYRPGRGGRSSHRQKRQQHGHPNARTITCNDGSSLEVHASYNFPNDVWSKIPAQERERLKQERRNFNRRRNNSQNQTAGTSTISSAITEDSSYAQSNAPTSIMGGRNEQASLRSRNPNNK